MKDQERNFRLPWKLEKIREDVRTVVQKEAKKKLEKLQAWRLKKDKLGNKIDPKKMNTRSGRTKLRTLLWI